MDGNTPSDASNVIEPFATGGGGTTFEFLVGADVALCLLLSIPYRGLSSESPPAEIRLQQLNHGHPVDDIIVVAADGRHRIDIQARHGAAFTRTNTDFGDALEQFAARVDQADFDAEMHRVGLAFSDSSGSLKKRQHLTQLTEEARCKSESEFFAVCERSPWRTQLLDIVRLHLDSRGVTQDSQLVNRLLKALVLLPYDVDDPTGRDRIVMAHAVKFARAEIEASAVIALLHLRVADTAKHGGTLDRATIERDMPEALIAVLPDQVRQRTQNVLSVALVQLKEQIDYMVRRGKYIPEVAAIPPEFREVSRAFCIPDVALHLAGIENASIPRRRLTELAARLNLGCSFPSQDLFVLTDSDSRLLTRAARSEVAGATQNCDTLNRHYSDRTDDKHDDTFWARHDLSSLAYGAKRRLEDILEFIDASDRRVFVALGGAGSGKTFVACELAASLETRSNPAVLLEARQLPATNLADLVTTIFGRLFPGASLAEIVSRLEELAEKTRVPYVVIIDGINEHRDPVGLLGLLRLLDSTFADTDSVKFVLTCRSEYYAQRFKPDFDQYASTLYWDNRFAGQDDAMGRRMIRRHLEHFNIQAALGVFAFVDLAEHPVLLRVFCEARKSPGGEPVDLGVVDEVHTEEVVSCFLERILRDVIAVSMPDRRLDSAKHSAMRVLNRIVDGMIDANVFDAVPYHSACESDQDERILDAFLDTEGMLREDIGVGDDGSESTLAFSLDEMRDWLIVNRLLARYGSNGVAFAAAVDRIADPVSTCFDGVMRILFVAGRRRGYDNLLVGLQKDSRFKEAYLNALTQMPRGLLLQSDGTQACAMLERDRASERFVMHLLFRLDSELWPVLNAEWVLKNSIDGPIRDVLHDILRDTCSTPTSHYGEEVSARLPASVLGRKFDRDIRIASNGRRQAYVAQATSILHIIAFAADYDFESKAMEFVARWIKIEPLAVVDGMKALLSIEEMKRSRSLWQAVADAAVAASKIDGDLLALSIEECGKEKFSWRAPSSAYWDAVAEIDASLLPTDAVPPKEAAKQIFAWFRKGEQFE